MRKTNKLSGKESKSERLHYEIADLFFYPCPFCGNGVDVFQVPETRYGPQSPYGWTLECKNMGCIFQAPNPDQSLKHLLQEWNKRAEISIPSQPPTPLKH